MKNKLITLAGLLALSTLLVAGLGAYLKYAVLRDLDLYQDESIIAVPFMLLADDAAQFALQNRAEQEQLPLETLAPAIEPSSAPTEADVQETQPPETQAPTEPQPTEPPYIELDESWFDDALFIGDSRTVGLRELARLGEADYFCAQNLTVFQVLNWRGTDHDRYYKKHLDEVLQMETYGKIFIHLGLNECGNKKELIIAKYQEIIDTIRTYQKDAVIILQSVMTVTDYKASNEEFSLERITALNEAIAKLAEDNGLKFMDTNEWAADEEGYLREEIAMDGAHPHSDGYRQWAAWILEKVKTLGIP